MLDGSSIAGWKAINEFDMPDLYPPTSTLLRAADPGDLLRRHEPSTAKPTRAAAKRRSPHGIGRHRRYCFFGPKPNSSSSRT